MLKAYKKPVNLENILTSYNAGIDYVVSNKKLPKETQNYISKYNSMLTNSGANIVKQALTIARGKNASRP